MITLPVLEEYDVSPLNGFLPSDPPLQYLSDPYYAPWEYIVNNLQGLMLSRRLRELVDTLPVLSTENLHSLPEWRRAYCALAFISHAYIWGGDKPAERVPPSIAVPLLSICKHLELPTVATFAGVCLWNWRPIFEHEELDLSNLDMINTFSGSTDEKWFYLISVAIEARGGSIIPLMLDAIKAADEGDSTTVASYLRIFAERLTDIGSILTRMYDECDPHVFYHRIRPYLAGSKNMASAGLPNGVIFDNGGPINKQRYVQYSGGSNAQSSLIQFFDLMLGVEHRPIGERKFSPVSQSPLRGAAQPHNFIHEMRKYMPGKHARFLEQVADIANIRPFVQERKDDKDLCLAFDACVLALTTLRDKHIQIVSRYIVIKSREAANQDRERHSKPRINLAVRLARRGSETGIKGTGGSSLIPFLRQARDETGEPAVGDGARRTLADKGTVTAAAMNEASRSGSMTSKDTWKGETTIGGLCVY